MEKRVLASNKEYKIKVESLQRQEQNLLHKLNKGREVIFEALSNNKEDIHKVTYMRNSLTAVRTSRKHEIDKHLLKAQKSANQIFVSCRVNDNPTHSISEEEVRSLEHQREILKKLTRISVGAEKRKKEIDENISHLTNLFKTLGMPDLNDCLNEYEQVVITNNSLSRKIDVLLKDISQIEKQIKKLKAENIFAYKKPEKCQSRGRRDEKMGSELKIKEFVYSTNELFRNLNGKLKKACGQGKEEGGVENFEQLGLNFFKVEEKVKKEIENGRNFEEDIEVFGGHVYVKRKEPVVNCVESLDPDVMYTENKHGYIADLQYSAIQVETQAKKIIKSLKKDSQRDMTPLVNNDQPELIETNHLSEIEKVNSFTHKNKLASSPAFLERNFEKNMKRVSSQNLLFRKKKQINPKNAKFYCQEMLTQQRKWSQTPKSKIGQLISPLTKSMNKGQNPKKAPNFLSSTPRVLNNIKSAENFANLRKIYRF